MRVLLDECVPRRLARELPGHDVVTVAEAGWAGVQNGKLLRKAERDFQVFLTVDQNLKYQQSLKDSDLAIVVLVSHSNEIAALLPLLETVRQLLRAPPRPGLYEVAS